MYLIFRCRCGRHLYAQEGAKTRTCPCGRRTTLAKARILARAEDAEAAGEMVRALQQKDRGMTGFRPAG
ncbi:MAG: DUF1922 domain-containing protein [Methanotrichaceae archaeon]|nr:DUF1922 domain-containing protein [Methanotrichaceae archaeon]